VVAFDVVVNKLVVPFLATVALNLFKMTAQRRFPSLNDANDTAIDLVVTSIMSFSELHTGAFTRDQFTQRLVVDFLTFSILLVRRSVRQGGLDAAALAGTKAPDVGMIGGVFELMAGLAAAIITVL